MLGLPDDHANIATTGQFGQIDARLWDISPNGTAAAGHPRRLQPEDNQTGQITFQLHGNGYRFADGRHGRARSCSAATRPTTRRATDLHGQGLEAPGEPAEAGGRVRRALRSNAQPSPLGGTVFTSHSLRSGMIAGSIVCGTGDSR